MTEKDLDVAIEKCERIMEFDTRTLKNPESENGYIFEKVYDLLEFLRELQFATDTNVDTTDIVSRAAAIEAMRKAKDKSEAYRMLIQMPSAQLAQDLPNGCTDTISRQAAIDALNVLCQEHRYRIPGKRETYSQYNEAWQDALDRAEGAIGNLPSAQPGWIPVTERLPKKDGDYLVTTHSGQIARYIFIGGSSEEYWRRCATAWMPLPKPWEGGQDG